LIIVIDIHFGRLTLTWVLNYNNWIFIFSISGSSNEIKELVELLIQATVQGDKTNRPCPYSTIKLSNHVKIDFRDFREFKTSLLSAFEIGTQWILRFPSYFYTTRYPLKWIHIICVVWLQVITFYVQMERKSLWNIFAHAGVRILGSS